MDDVIHFLIKFTTKASPRQSGLVCLYSLSPGALMKVVKSIGCDDINFDRFFIAVSEVS
jgi:hypothetical protein|tara:strand:- start:457 stop:633 length:177 start_codon:yes stop_codon:yes gene_type:complete